MFIKIDLKTTKKYPRKFLINLKDLQEAVKTCYLGLGAPYQPIPVDNFVSLGDNQFPDIPSKAKITIKLCPDNEDDCQYKLSDPKLVCCKVINVGRRFNDAGIIPKDYWKTIFKCDSKHIFNAPDGTLYVAPDKKNRCSITTKKKPPHTFIAYSIIFSLIIEHKDNYKRRYYFIIDPLLQIRSNPRN